jgi:DNA excision repair protein ERCC-3
MDFVEGHTWGLMLLDEVQVFPATNFSKITDRVKAHTKLGLTATLVREDGKISDIDY